MVATPAENANKTVETVKERSNMIKSRIASHLSQKEVARIMSVDIKSVINWEKAHTSPHLYQIKPLRDAINFRGSDEELLQVFEKEEPRDPDPCQIEPTRGILDSSDSHMSDIQESREEDMNKRRRNLNGTIAAGIGTALVPTALVTTTQIVTGPVIDPDEYLSLVEESISTWWQWLNIGNYPKLERVLLRPIPKISVPACCYLRSFFRFILNISLMLIGN